MYYYVYKDGTKNTVTGQDNVVVRTYTGYSNIPSINSIYVEDVYAVGIRTNRNLGTTNPNYVYTADVVVVELNENYRYQNTTSEQVFIPGATLVNNNLSRVAGQGWETVTMIRGNGEVEDVTVDLNSSIGYEGYDAVGGRGRITAGLYYMDPIDTNSSVYAIRKMSNADIRANNYLTGYVDSSTILSNNWVQVETMTYQGYDDAKNPNTPVVSTTLGIQGKKVDTENLYTLSGRTLTKALATTVFDQWPSIHVSNNNRNALNELYDKATDTFPGDRSNRNEVLVRYNGNSVVWAVSFAELDGSDVNSAQYTWYNNLVSDDNTVSSGVKFFGKDIVDNGREVINDSVDYINATGDAIEFSSSFAATIKSWSLQRYGTNEYSEPALLTEQKEEFKAGARYKLVVDFVSGGSKTYYLTLNPASEQAALEVRAGVTEADYLDKTVNPTALKLPNDPMNIIAYTKQFRVSPATANVTWNFKGVHIDFNVVSEIDRTTGNVIGGNEDNVPYGVMTNAINQITATVTNERGATIQVLTYNRNGGAPVTYKTIGLGRNVRVIYQGLTYDYTQAGTSVDVRIGDTITLTTVDGDYGKFTKNDGTTVIATTTADALQATYTVESTSSSRIKFISQSEADAEVAEKEQAAKLLESTTTITSPLTSVSNGSGGTVKRGEMAINMPDGMTTLTNNIAAFNDVYAPLFSGVEDKQVVAVKLDLTKFGIDAASTYRIKQTNPALNVAYGPITNTSVDTDGTLYVEDGAYIKDKGGYSYADLQEYCILLSGTNVVTLEITPNVTGAEPIVIAINSNVTVAPVASPAP